MSIFKATLKPYISRQINTRQNLLNQQGARGIELQQYVSGKSPWLKMTSLVNYKGSIELAKKYVLMGGTLYPRNYTAENQDFGLRSGVNGRGAAYGDLGDRQYGIRPMPGIESADIKTKSAYGSLREATIKYYAWDKKQHDDLAILFQTPGYPVLLEWGWSMYLDTYKESDTFDTLPDSKTIKDSSNIKMASFNSTTINAFTDDIRQTDIYDNLNILRHKYSGNYDGMLGFVRNFEWTLMPGGGYECTVVLISIGDVLDTIKMNTYTGNANLKDQAADYKDEFEVLLTRYASVTSDAERATYGDLKAIDDLIDQKGYTSKIDKRIYKMITKERHSEINNTYMQLGLLIFIINETKNLFLDNKEKLIDIEIPVPNIPKNKGNGLCVASKYSISIDPGTCIIRNSSADIFTSTPDLTGATQQGFNPRTYIYLNPTSINYEYLNNNGILGTIGHIYVNIGKIISIYRNISMSHEGTVGVGVLLKAILESLSYSLGSVNNFGIYVEDSKAVIIDVAYTEPVSDTQKNNKFVLNLSGTDTIVKNHKINSKIFPSQATMIAIGAGAGSNLGSVQSSTYNYMNEGITSRLYYKMNDSPNPNTDETEQAIRKKIYEDNILKLVEYVNTNVLQEGSVGNEGESIISTMNTYLNTLLVKIVEDTNYKAIVPISLEATLDGIGGMTIGEIFTVNKDILPKQYQDRSIGFIITGISNNITRPDWKTTITTQVCLLDQNKFAQKILNSYNNLSKNLNDIISGRKIQIYKDIEAYNIIIAFIHDFFLNEFYMSLNNEKANIDYLPDVVNRTFASGRPFPRYLVGAAYAINYLGYTLTQILDIFANSTYLNSGYSKAKAPKGYNTIEIKNIDNIKQTKSGDTTYIIKTVYVRAKLIDEMKNGEKISLADLLETYDTSIYVSGSDIIYAKNVISYIKSVVLSIYNPIYNDIKTTEIKNLLLAEVDNIFKAYLDFNRNQPYGTHYLVSDESSISSTGNFIKKYSKDLIAIHFDLNHVFVSTVQLY
jgi:hypothetical protein